MILSLLILVNLLVILDLLGASGIDLIYGVRLQTLEMIRHITVLRALRGRRHWILGHEVAHISSCNFLLVHILLIVGPGLLSIFLLLSKKQEPGVIKRVRRLRAPHAEEGGRGRELAHDLLELLAQPRGDLPMDPLSN